MLSVWGLVLLIVEQMVQHPTIHLQARELRSGHHGGMDWSSGDDAYRPHDLQSIPIAASFIAARGVVDLAHEFLAILGYRYIQHGRAYFTLGNMFAIINACIMSSLFFSSFSVMVRMFVVFAYWGRLLRIFTSAERIARLMLPLTEMVRDLGPSCSLTLLFFFAFMHAFYNLDSSHTEVWPHLFFSSFATLFTSVLPPSPEVSNSELLLTYAAILVFSLFTLNIFIVVISETYSNAQARVETTYKQVLANHCLMFLLRLRSLSCSIMSQGMAWTCTIVMMLIVFIVPGIGLYRGRPVPYAGLILILSLLLMF